MGKSVEESLVLEIGHLTRPSSGNFNPLFTQDSLARMRSISVTF